MSTHDPRLDITHPAAARVEVMTPQKDDAEAREARLVRVLTVGSLGAVAAWGAAIATFGWLGLFVPALVAVPLLFLALILITQG